MVLVVGRRGAHGGVQRAAEMALPRLRRAVAVRSKALASPCPSVTRPRGGLFLRAPTARIFLVTPWGSTVSAASPTVLSVMTTPSWAHGRRQMGMGMLSCSRSRDRGVIRMTPLTQAKTRFFPRYPTRRALSPAYRCRRLCRALFSRSPQRRWNPRVARVSFVQFFAGSLSPRKARSAENTKRCVSTGVSKVVIQCVGHAKIPLPCGILPPGQRGRVIMVFLALHCLIMPRRSGRRRRPPVWWTRRGCHPLCACCFGGPLCGSCPLRRAGFPPLAQTRRSFP